MTNEGTALIEKNSNTAKAKGYPAPFYCGQTFKLMKDPVVAPGGISYERSSWEARCQRDVVPSAPAYDNRALKQLIEEYLVENNDIQQAERRSSRAILMKMQHSARASLQNLVDKSILPSDDKKPLSEAYYCPITMSLMHYPVIGPEGYSFEREAISRWIDQNQVSPLTRTPLPSKDLLYPNLALQEMLKLEAKKKDASDSVREFKVSLMEEKDQEKQYREEYTGPQTLEEWEELRTLKRQANADVSVSGVAFLVVAILYVVICVSIFLVFVALFGWYSCFACCACNLCCDWCCKSVHQALVEVNEEMEAGQAGMLDVSGNPRPTA